MFWIPSTFTRQRYLLAAACLLATLALLLGLLPVSRVDSSEMGILVPAYFHPSADSPWDDLNEAAGRIPLIAILNPASGPGSGPDDRYAAAVTALREAGGRVIGYVHTGYGLRPLSEVVAEVDRYADWYAIDGIFVDEMSASGASAVLTYYADLYGHIKGIDAEWEVIGNPGTSTHVSHLEEPTADRLVVTENVGTAYPSYAPSPWNFDYDASRFAHLVHSEPSATAMADYVALARSRHAGLVYVTDDALPNPWNRLPSYWEAEVDLIAALNESERAGDYNGNGAVEQGDLDLVLGNWGQDATPPPIDWTGRPPQGAIDQDELDRVLLNWGSAGLEGASTTAILEPSSVVLYLLGTIGMVPLARARPW